MTNPDPPRTVGRDEWIVLSAIVLAGVLLRGGFLDRAAVAHYDEGVYVSNLWFGAEAGYRYPYRHLYAPPLVPAILEWSMILLGPGTLGTLLPGLVFGTATIPLSWWVARCWFGSIAGWAAALLVAFSGFLVVYSRTALVDGPMGFWVLLSVHLVWLALTRDSWRWSVAAGLVTGIAWWTKYNGWLPLAIALAGGIPWVVTGRRDELVPSFGRFVALWGIVAGTALVVWSPALWGLQAYGGYAAVAANHAGYVHGFAGWGDALSRQIANLSVLDELSPGLIGVLTAIAVPVIIDARRMPARRIRQIWMYGIGLLIVSLVELVGFFAFQVAPATLLVVVAMLTCSAWMAGEVRRSSLPEGELDDGSLARRSCGRWLASAWLFGLLLATPMYRAYPRLLLPGVLVACLGTAGAVQWLTEWIAPGGPRRPTRLITAVTSLVVVGLSVVGLLVPMRAVMWEDRTPLARIAEDIATDVRAAEAGPSPVYVAAEPALYHHLARLGLPVAPVGDPSFADNPRSRGAFLVVGPHAEATPDFARGLDARGGRFEVFGTYVYEADTLYGLNNADPRDGPVDTDVTLSVLRVR